MRRLCPDCVHIRHGIPVDPFEGVRLVSAKILELRARWEQELATRATFEEQRLLTGEPFDFEPIAFPYCAKYSSISVVDPTTAKVRNRYVACASANANEDCEGFEARQP